MYELDNDFVLLRLKCVVMKIGVVIVEFKDLETDLNRIKDLAGKHGRMSWTMWSGTYSDGTLGFLLG